MAIVPQALHGTTFGLSDLKFGHQAVGQANSEAEQPGYIPIDVGMIIADEVFDLVLEILLVHLQSSLVSLGLLCHLKTLGGQKVSWAGQNLSRAFWGRTTLFPSGFLDPVGSRKAGLRDEGCF